MSASLPVSEIRRFSMGDYTKYGKYLLERLGEANRHMSEQALAGWLRTINNSNDNLFIVSNHAIALATIVRDIIDPTPTVMEVFVYALPDSKVEDAATIYSHIKHWATCMGAKEMILECCTDIPRALVEKHTGKIAREAYSSVKLKK